MKNFYNLFLYSSRELKNVRSLVLAALLITIKLILDLFTIQITPVMHLSFEFLATTSIGMLFGPIVGAICGGMSDVINYIINPKGMFFPGFTISSMLEGIIYGVVLYKKKITITRCILANLTVVIIIDILLNTFWLSLLYGKSFYLLFPARTLKNITMIPINVTMMYFILKLVNKIEKQNY